MHPTISTVERAPITGAQPAPHWHRVLMLLSLAVVLLACASSASAGGGRLGRHYGHHGLHHGHGYRGHGYRGYGQGYRGRVYGFHGYGYGHGRGLRFGLGIGYPYRYYGGYLSAPAPRYLYQQPATPEPKVYVERPSVWYYCPGSREYYPHVSRCDTPWVNVNPATIATRPPDTATPEP